MCSVIARLGPIVLDVREDWADVTDDVGSEANRPWTLAKQSADACGSFQFSVAFFRGGAVPDPTPDLLAELVRDFGSRCNLGAAIEELTESAPLRLAAATFRDRGCVIRAWYVSDGLSFAKVTYTAGASDAFESELADCERMVRTIRFAVGSPAA